MAEHYEYQFPQIYPADTFATWVYVADITGCLLAEHLVGVNDRRIPPLDFNSSDVLVRFRKFESDDPWQAYRVKIRCEVSYEARKEVTDG